jgi:hypothetical protein
MNGGNRNAQLQVALSNVANLASRARGPGRVAPGGLFPPQSAFSRGSRGATRSGQLSIRSAHDRLESGLRRELTVTNTSGAKATAQTVTAACWGRRSRSEALTALGLTQPDIS